MSIQFVDGRPFMVKSVREGMCFVMPSETCSFGRACRVSRDYCPRAQRASQDEVVYASGVTRFNHS